MATRFDPVRLGGGRRGGPNRGLVTAVLLVAFVAVALWKPWELAAPAAPRPSRDASPADRPTARPGATAEDRPADGPHSVLANPVPGRPTAAASWADVAPALRLHSRWGVRALVDRLGRGLVERWKPSSPPVIVPPSGGVPAGHAVGIRSAGVVMDTAGGHVRVLGVTAPPDETPLDVRVWWVPDSGDPVWLDVRAVDPAIPGAHLLLLPPRRVDGTAASWPPGRYRVDLLLGRAVVRMTVILPQAADSPERLERDPFVPAPPGPRPAPANPYSADLGGLQPGAFVVADGIAVNVASRLGGPLDATGAWLDARVSAAFGGDRPRDADVADVWLPGINGIGVMLPAEGRLEWASLERLAPTPLVGVDAVSRSIVDARGGSPSVVFAPPRGGTWLAGTYAIDVRYLDHGFRRSGTYHIAIRPAPLRRSGALTAAVRAWAGSGGNWGILTGIVEPLEGGPADAAIRWWGQAPSTVAADPATLGTGCTGAARMGNDAVIGLAHPPAEAPESVHVERLFEGGRVLEVPVQASLGVVPGLSIVTSAAEQPFAEGYYRITAEPAGAQLVFCVGPARRMPDAVDPASASLAAFEEAAAMSASAD
jgi:hypothetical protein